MRQLIIYARPGIAVVSGYVKEVIENIVTIENNVWMPVSKRSERKRLQIVFNDKSKVKNMRLSENNFIVATCDVSDFNLDVVISGGETEDKLYYANGYNLRYNGSFDFAQRGDSKETHVFVGKIEDIKKNSYKGIPCGTFKMNFTSQRGNVSHNIGCWNKLAEQLEKVGRYAIVCGPATNTAYGPQYTARRIIEC